MTFRRNDFFFSESRRENFRHRNRKTDAFGCAGKLRVESERQRQKSVNYAMSYRIFPLGDNALTVEFGNQISVELNNRVLKLTRFFDQNRFPGFVEIVPAYASVSIFYNTAAVRRNFPKFPTAFDAVKNLTETGSLKYR
jgi:hypothetical protein